MCKRAYVAFGSFDHVVQRRIRGARIVEPSCIDLVSAGVCYVLVLVDFGVLNRRSVKRRRARCVSGFGGDL